MSNLIGKTIGQYQIIEQIGIGGMATVYKAYQPSMDRYVAVKILPSQLAQDPNFAKRFEHEAKAIAALEHPHILPIHDFGTAEGHTYMVMRYVEGGTLSSQMGRSIAYRRIVRLVSDIARALDYAHQQGVVHRDIKPSNILIDKHGEALLTDFGVAKMVAGSKSTQLTTAGSILGTPAYMSPEQAGSTDVDGRSDIYSLGVVLFELLTGQPPYRAETPLAVVLMHVNDPLPPPHTIKPDIPEPLERVVLKAMAKKAGDRFQTAGEMAQALEQALRQVETGPTTAEIPRAIPPTQPIPAPKAEKSMLPLLVGGGLLVLLLCIVGGSILGWVVLTPKDQGVAGATPTSSGGRVQATLPLIQAATPTPTAAPTEPAATTPTATPSPTPEVDTNGGDTLVDLSNLMGDILFQEDFGINRRGWHTGEQEDDYGRSNAELVDGRYRLTQNAKRDVVWWVTMDDVDFNDFMLTIDATPVEHNAPFAYGPIFRRTGDEDFYMFQIDTDGFFTVHLNEGGQWQTLIDYTELAAINKEGLNQITIQAIGSTLTFFVNDALATTIEDDTL
ncbi:MAG: serine/threonine-protein kinase, partial [Chloroflexota bacterium]